MTHQAVRVRCPMCQQQGDVPTHKALIYRCTNRRDSDFYAWTCPECGEAVTRRGDAASVCLLIAVNVRTVLYEWPTEIDDPQRTGRPWGDYEADDLSMDIAALPETEAVA